MRRWVHVTARLVQRDRQGREKARGNYDFVALPRTGDRMVVDDGLGGFAVFNVLYVEHDPVDIHPSTAVGEWRKEQGPSATVVVEYEGPRIV
jgi:hypothetical protein